MISVASTLTLALLTFGIVPEAWAAPIGTRGVHVLALRSMHEQSKNVNVAGRANHHSANAVVPRNGGIPDPSLAPRSDDSAPATDKRLQRRHVKNEERSLAPKTQPRYKRDLNRRGVSSSNVARAEGKIERRQEDESNGEGGAENGEGGEGDGKGGQGNGKGGKGNGKGGQGNGKGGQGNGDGPPKHPKGCRCGCHKNGPGNGPNDLPPPDGTNPDDSNPDNQNPDDKGNSDAEPPQKRDVKEDKKVARRSVGPIKPIAMLRRALALDKLD